LWRGEEERNVEEIENEEIAGSISRLKNKYLNYSERVEN
jgi:hypothetical protein